MTRSQIFKAAHLKSKLAQIANGGDYAAYFSFFLKELYASNNVSKKVNVEQACKKVETNDARVSAYPSRCRQFIMGNFRGKSSEYYKYDIVNKAFIYNKAGYDVEKAFKNI